MASETFRPQGLNSEHSLSSPWRDRNDRAKRSILPARPVGPVLLGSRTTRQAVSFAGVGVVSTLAYVAFYAALRSFSSAAVSNTLALLITAIGNTAANRRMTFAVKGREGLGRDHMAGLLAFGVALAITSASLTGLHAVYPTPSRTLELAVLVSANVVATLVRFVLLRLALDRGRAAAPPVPASTQEVTAHR